LAREIAEAIQELTEEPLRLSFVAHGTGGLIVRGALPWIQEHRHKLYLLVTIATPHVGIQMDTLSFAHRWRFCAMRKKSTQCWKQLALSDARYKHQSFVFRLSGEPCLSLFQRGVVLVSVHQDWRMGRPESAHMASLPEDERGATCDRQLASRRTLHRRCHNVGARFGLCKKHDDDASADAEGNAGRVSAPVRANVHKEMLERLLRADPPGRLVRVAAHLSHSWNPGGPLDVLSGSLQHGRLLENREFLKGFAHRYGRLLQ